MTTTPEVEPATIPMADLRRLAFCNSPKLPEYVNVNGTRMHWVGIGWVECREAPLPGDPVVID